MVDKVSEYIKSASPIVVRGLAQYTSVLMYYDEESVELSVGVGLGSETFV